MPALLHGVSPVLGTFLLAAVLTGTPRRRRLRNTNTGGQNRSAPDHPARQTPCTDQLQRVPIRDSRAPRHGQAELAIAASAADQLTLRRDS
jgi:hypothetical protein